jgi:deazaflavin-dependent oxidoreductase (nitroreductase family)
MRKVVSLLALSAAVVVAVRAWRRNPRIGTAFVNSVVNPALLRRGLAGGQVSELGTLEHFGRRSGLRRLTPVHPESTKDGFRILAPLGPQSHWARNVVAAGHCRIHVHGQVFDLDEPAMVAAADAEDLPWVVRRLMTALGFQYAYLRTFATRPGEFEPDSEAIAQVSGAPVGAAV